MHRRHIADALQSGYLGVGQAVRTWDPSAGEFSTWIMFRAQGAIADYIRREQSGLVGGRDSSCSTVGIQEEALTGEKTPSTLAELVEEETSRQVRDWLFMHSDDPLDYEIVCYRFGINDYPQLEIKEIARRVKTPYRTVENRLRKSLRRMVVLAEKSRYKAPQRENI